MKFIQPELLTYWLNLTIFAILAVIAALGGFFFILYPWRTAGQWHNPPNQPLSGATPADRGWAYAEINFQAPDGIALYGWHLPSQNGAVVIFSHGMGVNRSYLLDYIDFLAQAGYGVLAYDLRSHGQSEGEGLDYGGNEGQDIIAAAEFLIKNYGYQPDQIGAMGLSLGGQHTIFAAAHSDLIQTIVTDGACCTAATDMPPPTQFSQWVSNNYYRSLFRMIAWKNRTGQGRGLYQTLQQVNQPVLLIASQSEARYVRYHQASLPQPPVDIWLIEDVTHVGGFWAYPEAYQQRVIAFFDRHLLDN